MQLSRKHIKLLKDISKSKVVRTDRNDIKDIEYLLINELVTVTKCDKPNDFFYQPHISEKGKAVLDVIKLSDRRSNIAISISVFALIVSVVSSNWQGSLLSLIFDFFKSL